MTGKKPFSRPFRPTINVQVAKQEATIPEFFTASGTFRCEDMILNKEGLKLVSKANEEAGASPAADAQFTLADLETIKVIGKGSGGLVHLVRHKWTNEIYALKVIQMNIQETARRQIVQELKINKATECKYVVVCYHAFYQNGAISILLEYMDGGSLADIVKNNQVPEPHLSLISRQVLQGLQYLHHAKRIIHRDIKPSNLLLNHNSEAKITDFGVSAILEHSMAERDSFIGTYTYMSPERITGSNYSYDSDIWSLGLTLLECALGRFPYRRWLNFYELLQAIVEQPPPVPPADQFSPEFCSFISGCLQKDPKHRLSIAQLLDHPFLKKYENEQISLSELIPATSSAPE